MVFLSSLTGTSWPPSMIDPFLHPYYHHHHALIGEPFFGHPWPSNDHQERQVLQETSKEEQEQEKPSGEISVDNNPQHFSMAIDCQHFLPREVDVSIDKDTIVVHAHHQERGDRHGFIERQFKRRVILPPDVDVHQVSAEFTEDGQLLITAPKKPPRQGIDHDKKDHSKRTIEIEDRGHQEPPQRPREREDMAKQVATTGKTPAQQLAEADRLAPEIARQVKPEKKTDEEHDDRHRVPLTTQPSGQEQETSMSEQVASELPPQELQLLDHLDARPSTTIGYEDFIAEDVDVPMNERYELPTGRTEHPTRYYPAADDVDGH